MTTTQDTAIPLADNVIGASQGGHGLGPTSLSGRIALLTRFAELVAAHAEKWAMLGAEFKGLPPHWALKHGGSTAGICCSRRRWPSRRRY